MIQRLVRSFEVDIQATGLFWCRVCDGDPVTALHKCDGSRDRIHLLQLQLGPAALWTQAVSTRTHISSLTT